MTRASAFNRRQLQRILTLLAIAAVALVASVAGMVAYSARAVDAVERANETRLAGRRVQRTLDRLRADIVSATVWNDAYVAMVRDDADWMQLNFGDYYADYMHHEVTLAWDAGGRLVYASRDSEPVATGTESGFAAAVAPLVSDVSRRAAERPGAMGLDQVTTREGVVMVGAEPYFVTASTVVREDESVAVAPGVSPIVASGMRVSSFVPTLTADLGLDAPRLVTGPVPGGAPAVALKDMDGRPVAALTWTPARPGGELLAGAAPPLAVLLAVVILAVIAAGMRVFTLIRALAENEAALDRSLQDAQTANAAKSQFLANMSHELRTPLNGIIAMSELLRARQSDPSARDMTDTIVASGRTLENIVNDILDVARIESGQIRFELAAFDLTALLGEVAALHGAAAAAKGVRLELDIRPDAAGSWEGDRYRTSQILSNLLSNAVKFTSDGVIRVSARGGPAGLRIAVSDTGVGFDRAIAARLFQRFEQADVSVSRRFGGTGLGLSICSALAWMMGGRIDVRSVPGKGSVFIARLPLVRAEAVAPVAVETTSAAAADGPPLRILLADDHAVNRKVVALILEALSVELVQVENGSEAVEAVRASRFDLILMDVQMPVMDGLTAVRAIRALEAVEAAPRTPIISLTANAMPDDVARSLDAGADLHLAKPIRPAALIEAVLAVRAGDPIVEADRSAA